MKFNKGDRVKVTPNQDWNNSILLKLIKSCDYAVVDSFFYYAPDVYWCNIVLHGVAIDSCILMSDEMELLE